MTPEKNSARIFFALLPDNGATEAINFHINQYSPGTGRKVRPENYHITLLFLGNVDGRTIESLCMACGEIRSPAFSMTITRAGWWKKARILWLAPESTPPALANLVNQLHNLAGQKRLARDRHPYLPHITLMRKVIEAPQQPLIRPFDWKADSFSLMQSVTHPDGVKYQELARWQLEQ